MATLTSDRYLDDAACSAGEAFTLNGAVLTIRTDTRWHANSPASMTGTLDDVTISATLGGGYLLDGRNVRWLAFDTGTNNVPAIGTSITQGGVSGYLLGVWASLTAAPTAVGAAMPASGFLKFREVTGGSYSAGALTGIDASATSADVVGWIEVVHDQTALITVPRLGAFTVRGDWFDLVTTSGSANQLVQIPTNGSATAYVPGVWIANIASPATDDDYDFYPAILIAGFTTTNFGTDERSKFVCMEVDGSIRIGHNGTTTVGYVPASGRKIRIPNIIGRQCATATRATNAIPHATIATRPEFATTTAGVIDVDHFIADWYFPFAQAYSLRLHNFAYTEHMPISEIATAIDMYDVGVGHAVSYDNRSVSFTSCFAGGQIEKLVGYRYSAGTSDHAVEAIYCIGLEFINCKSGIITYARSSGVAYVVTQSTGIIFNQCSSANQGVLFTTSFDCEVHDFDFCDRIVGATTTSAIYCFSILASSENILIDGVTFGLGGTISNVHPYSGIFNVGQSTNIRLRNCGTRTAFLSGGSANNPAYIYVSAGNNQNVKLQRVYMTPTRTGAISTVNSDVNCIYEHVYGDFADSVVIADLNSTIKSIGGTNTVTGQTSVYGTHFSDYFTSDTAGRILLAMNEPTSQTSPYISVGSGNPKFTSAGGLVLATTGDSMVFYTKDFIRGHTGLTNSAPIVTGTNVTHSGFAFWGNHVIYFKIDINDGNGWNATWKDFNATELNAFSASINPDLGFKLYILASCLTASTSNLIGYIRINTDSTLTAQTDYLYPLDTNTLTITGLQTNSDIVILQAGTETARIQIDANAGTSYQYVYSTAESVDIGIFKTGYVPLYIRGLVLGTTDASLPVVQIPDRSYSNPV